MRVGYFSNRKIIILALTYGLLSGCDDALKAIAEVDDTDGDGLTDAEELVLGTSPNVVDSDGDGFSDFKEVKELGFNASTNNFLFNPLIADVPKMRIEIVSIPEVELVYSEDKTEVKRISASRLTEKSRAVTVSDTSSNSQAVEMTHTAGGTIGYDVGVFGGWSGEVRYDFSHATSSESSFSNTKEQSEENSESIERGEEFEEANTTSTGSGEMEVLVKVTNEGSVAFKLESLILVSSMVDSKNAGRISAIGNLNLDTDSNSFSGVTLGPNKSTGDLSFKSTLLLSEAKAILGDASGLIVAVAASEVVDKDGVAFAFRETDVMANTATIIVDYGGLRASERYLVATNTTDNSGTVKAGIALSTILKMPFTLDVNGSLDSVRSISSSLADSAFWLGIYATSDGVDKTVTKFEPESGGYDFANIALKAGDVLELMYLEDADHDYLGLRGERFAGTSVDDSDTDGDGILDGHEVIGYDLTVDYGLDIGLKTLRISSNPLLSDSDADGINDFAEIDPANQENWKTNPLSADTDNDGITDAFDPEPKGFNSLLLPNLVLESDGLATPSPKLTFDFPAIEANDDFVITYEVYRETVGITEDFTCGDDLSCFIAITPTPTATGLTHTDTTVSGLNKKHRYQLYVTINGSNRILVATEKMDTATDVYRVTVTFKNAYVQECVDQKTWYDSPFGSQYDIIAENDNKCEFYWLLAVFDNDYTNRGTNYTGTNLSAIKGAATVDSVVGDNLTMTETYTFDLPKLNTSCVRPYVQLFEKDELNNAIYEGDKFSEGIGPNICGDSLLNYSNSNAPIELVEQYNLVATITEQRKYSVKVYYTISAQIILAP